MPVRRFFAMEKQINRIRAESDLRSLSVVSSAFTDDRIQKVQQALVVEQGEIYQIERSKIVEAESGAINKLKALMA